MTRLAAQRILEDPNAPEGLQAFIRLQCPEAEKFDLHDFVLNVRVGPEADGIERLAYWSIHPDIDRSTPVPALNSIEAKMHYIDLEFFNKEPENRQYFDDLRGLPTLADIPRDPDDPRFKDAGFLPFRVEQCYNELVKAFVAHDDESAMRWAGYLAHYLQDNTQPHHATIDFRSHYYFRNLPRGDRPNVHGWMEYGFIDDEENAYPDLRKRYADLVVGVRSIRNQSVAGVEPGYIGDPYSFSLNVSLSAYKLLPTIGRGALAAHALEGDLSAFARTPAKEGDLLLQKANLGAAAAFATEAAWRQAWAESQGDYERPDSARTMQLQNRPSSRPADR